MTNPSEHFLFLPSSAPGIFPPIPSSPVGSGSCEKPRKRRSRMIAVGHPLSLGPPSPGPRKHANRRPPGPDAPPEITHPCTECGKKFWSWKALFGHMRCHPERQWRGMNPPVNFQPRPPEEPDPFSGSGLGGGPAMTEEDHEVAQCLLLLASGHNAASVHETDEHGRAAAESGPCPGTEDSGHHHHLQGYFECSSCKKVFGSHQALGGHRASHKNVKGCFANAMVKIGSLGCSGTVMVTDDVNKTAFRESEDPGASRTTTQFIMNSSSFATTNQACDVDLSLRLGL